MDGHERWLRDIEENMSVEELLIEVENERQALREIQGYAPYDDQGRQIDQTRENIGELQAIIGRRTGSRR